MNDMSFLIYLKNKQSIGIDVKDIKDPKYSFIKCSIYSTPFKEREFDNITMMEIIEHLGDIEKALNETKRILKDDGKLIISTPDANIIWNSIWFILTKTVSNLWKDEYISNYGKKKWAKIISKYFNIISVQRNYQFDLIFECTKK